MNRHPVCERPREEEEGRELEFLELGLKSGLSVEGRGGRETDGVVSELTARGEGRVVEKGEGQLGIPRQVGEMDSRRNEELNASSLGSFSKRYLSSESRSGEGANDNLDSLQSGSE